VWLSIFVIFLCILFNALFSASEIALVSVRKSRVKKLMEEGRRHAHALCELKERMGAFLATIQLGVNLVGIIASAVSGAIAVERIKPFFERLSIPLISSSAGAFSLAIVVFLITYAFIVFGELIPKSLALAHPDTTALSLTPFVRAFSAISRPAVKALVASTDMILKPFGGTSSTERSYITAEEVKLLLEEGGDEGIFEAEEKELIKSVFEFSDTSVKEVMVPTMRMVTVRMDMSFEEIRRIILEEKFSRYPVLGSDLNDVRGILYARDFFMTMAKGEPFDIRRVMKRPLFIPETMKISNLMRKMQRERVHMAIVVDEYGSVSGLVTMEDLLEEIVGEIRDEYDTESPVVQLRDGSLLVDASISIADLKKYYGVELEESDEYESLGGLFMTVLQRVPEKGDTIEMKGMNLRVIETEGPRIVKIKIERS